MPLSGDLLLCLEESPCLGTTDHGFAAQSTNGLSDGCHDATTRGLSIRLQDRDQTPFLKKNANTLAKTASRDRERATRANEQIPIPIKQARETCGLIHQQSMNNFGRIHPVNELVRDLNQVS